MNTNAKKKTMSKRVAAAITLAAILLSLFAGIYIGRLTSAQTVSVATPNGIIFAETDASLVYDVDGNELVMLTIAVDNAQTFDFLEVEWAEDYNFQSELLKWGAEKFASEKFTRTNEVIHFDGNNVYVRLRATVDGQPSPWSQPVEVVVRVEEIPEEEIPNDDTPAESNIPAPISTGTPVDSTPVESQPVESNPVESQPVIGTPIVVIENPIEEHTHTVASRETRHVEATCLQNGVIESETYCTECNVVLDKTSETLIAIGHSYTEIERVEPQIGKTGYVVYECTRCGDRYTVTLPALVKDHEHQYTTRVETSLVSCTKSGAVKLFCSCGAFIEEYVAPLGHTMSSWTVIRKATENETGLEERTCTRCGYAETREIAKLGHTHQVTTTTSVTVEPTCVSTGIKTTQSVCSSCGIVINSNEETIPALGHDMGEWYTIIAATSTTEGMEQRDCTRCDHNETRSIPVSTADCSLYVQTMTVNRTNRINLTIVNQDIDAIDVYITNGIESDHIYNVVGNAGSIEVTNMTSNVIFTTNGTYEATIVGSKLINGQFVKVCETSASLVVDYLENTATDITTDADTVTTSTTTADASDTIEITTETVEEVVEVVETEVVEVVETVSAETVIIDTLIEG